MRAVLDTDVKISRLNFSGREHDARTLARSGRYELYLSPFILAEVAGVLERKCGWDTDRVRRAVAALSRLATVMEPEVTVTAVEQDDPDNRVLECAVAARADFLVTGDRRHLLPLREYQGTRIVTTAEFLHALEEMPADG